MPKNSEITVTKPPVELNETKSHAELEATDKIIDEIELLEEHGFTVLVRL